jgi:hypothetical protein
VNESLANWFDRCTSDPFVFHDVTLPVLPPVVERGPHGDPLNCPDAVEYAKAGTNSPFLPSSPLFPPLFLLLPASFSLLSPLFASPLFALILMHKPVEDPEFLITGLILSVLAGLVLLRVFLAVVAAW